MDSDQVRREMGESGCFVSHSIDWNDLKLLEISGKLINLVFLG